MVIDEYMAAFYLRRVHALDRTVLGGAVVAYQLQVKDVGAVASRQYEHFGVVGDECGRFVGLGQVHAPDDAAEGVARAG